jgi:hypothetical protein
MIKRKLIYISCIRLTDKVSRDWYIDFSIQKGVEVEFWDIVSLVRDDYNEYGALDVNYLRQIKTYNELEVLLQLFDNKNAVYVVILSYSGFLAKPFRLLSKYNCKMVFLSWGAMPPSRAGMPRWKRILGRLFTNPLNFALLCVDKFLGLIYQKLNIVKRFDIVFAAGTELISVKHFAKKIVPFNLCDFDHYIKINKLDGRITGDKYAVFIDINLPYQSDLTQYGALPAVNPTNYFNSLNRFFDLLEASQNIKIIIAAHPKTINGIENFNQRRMYRLLTAELVKDAEFVIMHTSTALSYAVLNLKPILFIYTEEMMNIYKDTFICEIQSSARYLNEKTYNIDKISKMTQIQILNPNKTNYENYKYNYLTSIESENLTSEEIFFYEINSLWRL